MAKHITIIGAGIVGIATASYLRRDGHAVTVVDMRPPGEYCSFGNAGILSPGSCVPQALPGVLSKVPGYLSDPLGPLSIRPAHFLKALPWFMRLVSASRLARVEQIADALRPLLAQTFDAYMPLVQHANVTDLIRRTGYVVAYATRAGLEKDALPWKLRRDRGVVMEALDSDVRDFWMQYCRIDVYPAPSNSRRSSNSANQERNTAFSALCRTARELYSSSTTWSARCECE